LFKVSKVSKVFERFAVFAWPVLAALATAWPLAAAAASFPCEKAKTAVEVAICASPQVSELDEFLGRYYAAARLALKHADECLVADQRQWLQTVRNPCKTADCLRQAYLRRLSVLHAVQPGASSLRTMALPAEPQLLWIVPPAADQVAAPRIRPTRPWAAQGRIVNEVASGDGYVLQTAAGRKHLIVGLMFLEAPTSEVLAQLATDTGHRYEVRGQTDAMSGDAGAFSPGRCAYVYRAAK
jgi:uncharacterized protein